MKKACEICGISRKGIIDRCHIVPKFFTSKIVGLGKYTAFRKGEGINTFYLCKNHHTLFDSFSLTDDELEKITPQLMKMRHVILNLLNSKLKMQTMADIKRKREEPIFLKGERAFNRWKHNLGSALVKSGIFIKYGETKT